MYRVRCRRKFPINDLSWLGQRRWFPRFLSPWQGSLPAGSIHYACHEKIHQMKVTSSRKMRNCLLLSAETLQAQVGTTIEGTFVCSAYQGAKEVLIPSFQVPNCQDGLLNNHAFTHPNRAAYFGFSILRGCLHSKTPLPFEGRSKHWLATSLPLWGPVSVLFPSWFNCCRLGFS